MTAEADIATDEDEDIVELADETEATESEIENAPFEPTDRAAVETDEDKQILELIDDIQSTLDETKETETESTEDEVDQTPLAEEVIDKEESFEKSIILGDEETFETEELSYSESEFVDHLGLDLTSEFSKELFEKDSEISVVLMEKIEKAVERVIHKIISNKHSPLFQAIIKAVKKEVE